MITHPQALLNYFARVGAEVVNHRRAMVKIFKGHYYFERALIKIGADGTVKCSVEEFAPTPEEAKAIKEALEGVSFPASVEARSTDALRRGGLVQGDLYEFYNRSTGGILMAQERRLLPSGAKAYLPWTLFADGEWACMEPDGPLPFWKPRVGLGAGLKVMIHEGAKAASTVTELLEGSEPHPWRDELAAYEHWGMIGGALAPHRTDYDELKAMAPSEVVYVCDNDHPGKSALGKVSQRWGKSLKGVTFGDNFPQSWDCADPIPSWLRTPSGRYVGPSLRDLMREATWATEVLPSEGKGRGPTVIRNDFAEEWLHCVTPEVFVHKDWPNRILAAQEFNNQCDPFSHVSDTAKLLKKEIASKAAVLKYNPAEAPGIYGGSKSGLYINTFAPSGVRPEAGDVGPWIEFMNHLVVDDGDRKELLRWCATLIARPEIRMLYGCLLISETQGIGKGTLGEKILAPLVGEVNVSYPSEQEIVDSNFNYWLAHKRLAVVHEIYAGHSSKAYNKLKSALTDRFVTVQKKYQANYEVECWLHIFACSNSMRAMKLSMDDRRWFVPKLTEEKRSTSYWEGLNTWLRDDGGLGHILAWAPGWLAAHGGPVERGAPAPWSTLKREIVEEGFSPGQTIVARVLGGIEERVKSGELPEQTFLLDVQLVDVIKQELYEGRHNDRLERPATVRGVAKGLGWHIGEAKTAIKEWGPSCLRGRVLALNPEVARTGGPQLRDAGARPLELQGTM